MFATMLIIFLLFCMITNPERYITTSLNGISAWAFNVLPSVLPFMFFTRFLSSLNTMQKLTKPFSKLSGFLFKTPSISLYAFVMAILSGYPVGSKLVADLFMQGQISKEDAFKMISFCSTSGPMFIVGAVGIGMFKSVKIGYILFASHMFSAIINGIIFRYIKLKNNEKTQKKLISDADFDFSDIVLSSITAILSVGLIITVFFIIIETLMPVFNLFSPSVSALLQGIIEITKGSLSLSLLPSKNLSTVLCSFVISFGGLSTFLQSITMISKINMPAKLFLLQKIMHGLLSCIITFLLVLFL